MSFYDSIKQTVSSVSDCVKEKISNTIENASGFGLDRVLKILKDKVINPYLTDIATVTHVEFVDKTVKMRAELKGFEGDEVEIICNKLYISEDGSKITLGDFISNKQFAQNALNKFAADEYKIPNETGVHLAMMIARKILGLEEKVNDATDKNTNDVHPEMLVDSNSNNEEVNDKEDTSRSLKDIVSESANSIKDTITNAIDDARNKASNLQKQFKSAIQKDEIEDDPDLLFLENTSSEDLDPLVNYLIKDTNGSLRNTEELTKCELYQKYSPDHHQYWKEIVRELQLFGGNSIVNLFRGNTGVKYREILIDVCDHLKVNYNKEANIEVIESNLLMKIITESLEKMNSEDLKKVVDDLGIQTTNLTNQSVIAALQAGITVTGYLGYNVALIVANSASKSILGKGLSLAANTTLSRTLGILAGPIGWILTGIWTAVDLAGPAYRVTVPSIIQIAYLRTKQKSNI